MYFLYSHDGTHFFVNGCQGDNSEVRNCNDNECPIWSEWTIWTDCTVTCGGGKTVRTRRCGLPDTLTPEIRALFCAGGDATESKACNEEACPVPTEWSGWSQCSKSCGGGTRTKTRQCNQVTLLMYGFGVVSFAQRGTFPFLIQFLISFYASLLR